MTAQPPDEAGDDALADLGELAGPLAHEFNNLINNLGLHLTVLEPDLPPQTTEELAEIRRQMTRVSRLVQQYQRVRRRRLELGRPVDLGHVLPAAAATVAREAADPDRSVPVAAVRLELPDGLPPVCSSLPDLRRLCLFLLRNAARHAAAAGTDVGVTAVAADGRVCLRIDDPGPPLTDQQLLQVFDPYGDGRDGTFGLELAASTSMARRLGGKLSVDHRAGGGAVFVLDLPTGE